MDIMYRKGWLTLKYCFYVLALLGLFLTLGGGCGNGGGGEEPIPPPTAENKLNVQITSVTIPADNKPVVTFRITDDQGNPIDRKAAGVNMRFIIARIPRGEDEYSNYITLVQKSSITGQSAVQADSEGSSANPLGTFSDQGNGVSTYTFNTALPEGYDKNVTHTVGIFATATIQGRVYVSNATFNFIPSGGEVTTVRDVVRTENCNNCHDPLEAHGGARRDVKLCVLCHSTEIIDPKTGQSVEQVDPDTGNNIGFPILIHKIHRGEDLPSVKIAGKPYQIIGFRGSVNDFSNVVFPQDIRNCTKCHTGGTQSDRFETAPARDACGSCHDDVNFASGGTNFPGGMSHGGGIQLNDNNCSGCHLPSTGKEFDLSVEGSHTIPTKSKQLAGVNFQIVSVVSAETGSTTVAPGEHPKVTFRITTDNGAIIPPSSMNFLNLTLSGPTSDYNIQDYNGDSKTTPGVENQFQDQGSPVSVIKGAVGPDSSGNFTYKFNGHIPTNASGTYAVGIEGYRCATVQGSNAARGGINCDGTLDLNKDGIEDNGEVFNQIREAGHNVVFYFPVTDSQPVPRRQVVDTSTTCINCHGVFSKDFSIHGNIRNNTEYCVLCHNPSGDDIPFRAPASGTEQRTTSINFRVMIHKIHTGENLTQKPYTIIGFRGSVNDFSDVRFPGDRGDCQECHLDQTFLLNPGHGILGSDILQTTEREIDSSKNVTKTFLTTPIVSTCTSCHDNLGVNANGDGLTGENHSIKSIVASENECVTCHGAGEAVDVQNVHLPFLPPDERIGRPEDPNRNVPSP
jgi:OmcA/MtrC family decaheme c-type cytochrome